MTDETITNARLPIYENDHGFTSSLEARAKAVWNEMRVNPTSAGLRDRMNRVRCSLAVNNYLCQCRTKKDKKWFAIALGELAKLHTPSQDYPGLFVNAAGGIPHLWQNNKTYLEPKFRS